MYRDAVAFVDVHVVDDGVDGGGLHEHVQRRDHRLQHEKDMVETMRV